MDSQYFKTLLKLCTRVRSSLPLSTNLGKLNFDLGFYIPADKPKIYKIGYR